MGDGISDDRVSSKIVEVVVVFFLLDREALLVGKLSQGNTCRCFLIGWPECILPAGQVAIKSSFGI